MWGNPTFSKKLRNSCQDIGEAGSAITIDNDRSC